MTTQSKKSRKTSAGRKSTSPTTSPASRKRRKNFKKHSPLRNILALLFLLICVLFGAPQLAPETFAKLEKEFPYIREVCELSDDIRDALLSAKDDSVPADSSQFPAGAGTFQIDFLDVGQGLSVLIEADDQYMLYDGGDRGASSLVVSYLEKMGVERLDYVIASHYDADHINGLVGALNNFDAEQVLGPDYTTDTKVYRSLVSSAKEQGLTILTPEIGARYPLGDGYFEILAPLSDGYTDVNNYSIVIRFVYGDNSFLLTGDAETDSEAELLAKWSDAKLKSDVLCVGHHGSPTSSSEEFLDRVQPDTAVISCGKDNSYGHPDASVLDRLNKRGIDIWRTDECGIISVTGNGEDFIISSEKTPYGR